MYQGDFFFLSIKHSWRNLIQGWVIHLILPFFFFILFKKKKKNDINTEHICVQFTGEANNTSQLLIWATGKIGFLLFRKNLVVYTFFLGPCDLSLTLKASKIHIMLYNINWKRDVLAGLQIIIGTWKRTCTKCTNRHEKDHLINRNSCSSCVLQPF